MVKTALLLLLVSVVLTANVPCTQFQDSKFGTASNCTITRLETNSIQWSTIIHFTTDFKWTNSSTSNLLADLSSPRLPVNPSASKCETVEGSYKKG